MLIPICCFSCGACIGHLWDLYKKYVEYYEQQIKSGTIKSIDNGYADDVQRRINNKDLETPGAEELALLTLGVKRLCCRRMFLTQVDTYNIMNLTK